MIVFSRIYVNFASLKKDSAGVILYLAETATQMALGSILSVEFCFWKFPTSHRILEFAKWQKLSKQFRDKYSFRCHSTARRQRLHKRISHRYKHFMLTKRKSKLNQLLFKVAFYVMQNCMKLEPERFEPKNLI